MRISKLALVLVGSLASSMVSNAIANDNELKPEEDILYNETRYVDYCDESIRYTDDEDYDRQFAEKYGDTSSDQASGKPSE